MASTVTMNMMSGSGTSMRSGTGRVLHRGFDASEEGDAEARSNRSSNSYGRNGGGGGSGGYGYGYGYPDSTASSSSSHYPCVGPSSASGGLTPEDTEKEGGGGGTGSTGAEGKKEHPPLPRGTPSRARRSHRKGSRSLADSAASTASGGSYPAIAEGFSSGTTAETATATDATPQRDRLDRRGSDDPFSTSFSEFSSGGSRRVAGSPTTPRGAGTGGFDLKGGSAGGGGEAPGVAAGGRRREARGGGGSGADGGGVATGNVRGGGGGVGPLMLSPAVAMPRGDPGKILEMLVGNTITPETAS